MNHSSWIRQLGTKTVEVFGKLYFEKRWAVFLSTCIIDVLLLCVLDKDTMFIDYMETRTGLFAIACACIWIGLFNSVQSICRERATIKHEHMMANLRLSAYICAHLLYEAFICLVEALLTEVIMIWHFREAVQSSRFSPVDFFLTLFLLTFAADACGMLISAISRTPEIAMTIMPFVLIVQLIMSGFIFNLKGFTKALSYLTISKWGMRTLCVCCRINQYAPEEVRSYEYAVYNQNAAEYNTGGAILIILWLVLILFVVLFSVLSAAALQSVDRDRR